MKKAKLAAGILSLLLFGYLVFLFITDQRPDLERVSHHLEMSDSNTFFLAENKKYLSLIYEVDEKGKIIRLYERSNNTVQNKEIIKDLCYEQNLFYLVERSIGINDQEYEVFRVHDDWMTAESLGVLNRETTFRISNFTVSGSKIYITGIDTVSLEQTVYEMDLTQEKSQFQVILMQSYPTKANGADSVIVDNYFDGTNLYTLTNQGMLYRYQKNSALGIYMEEPGTISSIFDSHSGVLSYSQDQQAVLHINQDMIRKVDDNPQKGMIDMTMSLNTNDQAVIYRDNDLKKTISCTVQGKTTEINKLTYGGSTLLKLYFFGIVIVAGGVLYLYAMAMLIFFFLSKMRKTALTLATLTFFLNVSFIAAVCVWNYMSSRNSLYENRGISTIVYLFEEITRLDDKVVIKDISFDNFEQSEWFHLADEALWDWVIPNFHGNEILFQLELVELSEDGSKMLVSKQNASGRDIRGIYSKELLQEIQKQGAEPFMIQKRTSFEGWDYMYVLDREEDNYMWIARAEIKDIPERIKSAWIKSVAIGLLFGSISSVLFMRIIFRLLKPLKKMSKAMEKVSLGIYDLPEEIYPDNEFGDMWKYLHRMCNALRAREYSSDNVLNYYQRFAPRNFELLLGADSIQDVRVGDRNRVPGSVAMLSIMDPKDLHEDSKRHAFLQTAGQMMKYIGQEGSEDEGILLQEGYRGTSFRKLYQDPDSAGRAYRFAMELLRELYALEEELVRPSMLLHSDSFLCGLSGTDSIVCPYIISESTEILGSYLNQLSTAGIRLAITEEFAEQLSVRPPLRFIGHLSGHNGTRKYHLYEVLESCPKAETLLKTNYNGVFQQGLQLYGQNLFYEARNCFAEMVKVCPADGVAKWYLFACDSIMEKGLPAAAGYDLFAAYENE